MLNNTLNTNEIKDSIGSEVEFTRLSIEGRKSVFAKVGEAPNMPHRLTISHTESGTGVNTRRRSMFRFDRVTAGQADDTVLRNNACIIILDAAVGDTSAGDMTEVLANAMSFFASLGASTTILYNGTGNGAQVLLTGGL